MAAWPVTSPMEVEGTGGSPGQINFSDGTNEVQISAPTTLSSTVSLILPNANGTPRQGLARNSGIGTEWVDISLQIFDAIVALSGGDFTTVAAAFNSGATSVYVRDGTYVETLTVTVPDGGTLVGESQGNTIIDLSAGVAIETDGSGGVKETAGTVSITSGAVAVTGVGTTFTNLSVGQFILIGAGFYEIATITNATNLTIVDTYQGATITSDPYIGQAMFEGITMANFTATGGTGNGVFMRACRRSHIETITITNCNIGLNIEDCGFVYIEGVSAGNCTGITGTGILVDDSAYVSLSSCGAFNSSGVGIEVTGACINVSLDACGANNNGSFGINIADASSSISITDSIANYNDATGINTEPSTGNTVINSSTCRFNAGDGIDFDSSECTITGCICINNILSGIQTGTASSISTNQCSNNGVAGIQMTVDPDCSVTGNVCHDNGTEGIFADGANITFTSNVCYNNTSHGIQSEGDNCSYAGNVCRDNTLDGINASGDNTSLTTNRCHTNTGNGVEIVTGATDCIVAGNNLLGNTGANLLNNGTATIIAGNKT